MSRHVFQRTGLITYDGLPGHNWGEFTRSFDREDSHAMETLGSLATYLVLETVEPARITTYPAMAERFAREAEPPIDPEGWSGMSFGQGVTMTLDAHMDAQVA